jgi:hypothetical protein
MGGGRTVDREWVFAVANDEARIRCRYRRRGNRMIEYTVQLEIWQAQTWRPILRYDNAHGYCHRDIIHSDGTQTKVRIYRGDTSSNFTWAIKELRANWQSERARFLAEVRP